MRKRIWIGIFMILLLTGCGASKGAKEQSAPMENAVSGQVSGLSANMRNGGLAAGDDEGIYYVWEEQLFYEKDGSAAECLDQNGARYLCLTEDQLYYVSQDEDGKTGIYCLDKGKGKERKLLLQTGARYLYEYEGWLYYINYPETLDVCRVRTDGSDVEILAEGRFDSLIVTETALYYRNVETGQLFKKSFFEETGQAVDRQLKEAEEWVPFSGDVMPMIDGEWLYYELGDSLWHYKVSTEDRTSMGRIARSSDNMILWEGRMFEDGYCQELGSGERTQWTDELWTKLYAVAGNRLIYQTFSYAEDELVRAEMTPQTISLCAYDMESGEIRILQQEEENRTEWTQENANKAFDRLLGGDLTLLLENQTTFAKNSLPTYQEWKSVDLDLDGDGVAERFLQYEKNSIVLHAEKNGVRLYLFDTEDETEWYEPLTDGTVLYRQEYENAGYHNSIYDIYGMGAEGTWERIDSWQHFYNDLERIDYDASTDSLLKQESYFAGEEFTDAVKWQKGLDSILAKRVWDKTE